jgi:hypothetical protein
MAIVKKGMSMTIEVGRLQKLRQVSEERKKTMTQLVEDWIDTLELKDTTNNVG